MTLYSIAYNGGAYGNFISWSLMWATNSSIPVEDRPWGEQGNAHQWDSKVQLSVADAIANPIEGTIYHPRQKKDDKLEEILFDVLKVYEKIILIYPSSNDLAWGLNNKAFKSFGKGFIEFCFNENSNDLESWGEHKNQTWALREWLSISIVEQFYAEIEVDTCIAFSNKNVLKVEMYEIKHDFHNVLSKMINFIDKSLIRSNDEITSLYNDWYSRQEHIDKDTKLQELIDAIMCKEYKIMDGLTIIDQALIQYGLRNLGYEIKCFGLNEWPKTTLELLPFLYQHEKS